MKKFLKYLGLFLLILPLVVYIRPLYLLQHDRYKHTVAGSNIYDAIQKSKSKNKARKLLLGDSVADQLFPTNNFNDTVNSLICNQAISMAGQYVLLKNYLDAGNHIDTLYLIYNPFSLQDNLDQVFTFHYFIKPFYVDDNMSLFNDNVKNQINKIPFHNFAREPYILTSNWAPDYKPAKREGYSFLSPTTGDYLQNIKKLSEQFHFKWIVIPAPVNEAKKTLIQAMSIAETEKYGIADEFRDYFNQMIYLPDNKFYDGTHLKDPAPLYALYREKFVSFAP